MVRSTRSKVARSLMLAGGVAAMLCGASSARAGSRYGFIQPHAGAAKAGGRPLGSGSDTQCGVVTYCGGPVISNVQVVPVYWTSGVSTTIEGWAPSYFASITNSTFMDMLSEYSTKGKTGTACGVEYDGGLVYFGPTTPFTTNQSITRGSSLTAVTITPTVTTGTSITDDDASIGAELTSQIAAGHLPAPTYDAEGYPNTIYFVFFPQSYSITLQGGGSCTEFGGYHYSTKYTAEPTCTGQYVPYAVIPDCGDSTDSLSITVSHELAEATSDTDVGPTNTVNPNNGDGAWYLGPDNPSDNPPATCGEIGDVCENQGGTTVVGTSVSAQYIWSQVQNGCEIENTSLGVQKAPTGAAVKKCPVHTIDAGAGKDGGGTGSDSGADDSGTETDATIGTGSPDSGGTIGSGGGDGAAITTPEEGGAGATNGNGATGSGGTTPATNSGCSCTMTPSDASPGMAAFGALVAGAFLARGRKRKTG